MKIHIVISGLNEKMSKQKILCFGDSHTYGFDPHHFQRYRHPWPTVLQSLMKNSVVYAEGLNGRSIQFDDPLIKGKNGMKSLPKILLKHPYMDVIIVMLGTNDLRLVFHAQMEEIIDGMKRMISLIQRYQPQAAILLISPPPLRKEVAFSMWKDDFDDTCYQASLQLANAYKEVAKTCACHFLDAAKYVQASPYDCVHMSEEDHAVFARVVYEQFFSNKEKA